MVNFIIILTTTLNVEAKKERFEKSYDKLNKSNRSPHSGVFCSHEKILTIKRFVFIFSFI